MNRNFLPYFSPCSPRVGDHFLYSVEAHERLAAEEVGLEHPSVAAVCDEKVYMAAAKKRGEAREHVLLYGAPGLGKTDACAHNS